MKKALPAFLLLASYAAFAGGDTLTRAQIYSFSVGDTFDYKEHFTSQFYPGINDAEYIGYKRCVIQAIYYSLNNDTLFAVRRWEYPLPIVYDTLIVDSLQYPVALRFGVDTCQASLDAIDTSSIYNHAIANQLIGNCIDSEYVHYRVSYQYCAALGLTSSLVTTLPFEGDVTYDSTYLIYYSKGNLSWGIPYYVADGSDLVHYTPIPEDCATWVATVGNVPCGPMDIKITTGYRIAYDGHTYVEMNFSGRIGNDYTSNSLVGYFRNDTLNRKAYIYGNWQAVIDSSIDITYDFSAPAGGSVLSLSRVNVGGQLRTLWNAGSTGYGYIEGVGGTNGMYPQSCWFYDEEGQYQEQITTNTYLTCFSVCGQTLYPYDSTASCSLADVRDVDNESPVLKIFPNPANNQITLSLSEPLIAPATFEIFNQLDQIVLNNQLNSAQTPVVYSLPDLANGIYFWRLTRQFQTLSAGKLAVVK